MAASTADSSPSLISLRELEPSPIESPLLLPDQKTPSSSNTKDRKESYFTSPPPAPSQSQSTTFLGFTKPTLPNTLLFLQKYSTYPFTLFLGMHITNTALIPLLKFTTTTSNSSPIQDSDNFLLLTRPYYQSTLLEPLLIIAPILIHILSGLALRIHRRRILVRRYGDDSIGRAERRKIPYPKVSLQAALGYTLIPLVLGHSFLNRWFPLWVEGGSTGVGLRYVAHGFAKHPVFANLGFGAVVGVGSWHWVGGVARWGGWGVESIRGNVDDGQVIKSKKRRRWAVNSVAALVAGVWMLGGLGIVGTAGKGIGMGWEVRGWDKLYSSIPIVGQWMK